MRGFRIFPGLAAMGLVLLAGCSLSPLSKNTAAFSRATSLVTDNTENAYRATVRLDQQAQASLLVARFDSPQPMDPHSIKPLLNERGLEVRGRILAGLRTYAQTIADLTGGVSSPKLDEAAASSGASLKTLGDSIGSATSGFTASQDQANGASAAFKALGDMLASRQVKRSVPKILREMDPNVEAITVLLASDIETLRQQSANDYEQILEKQDSFLRNAGTSLSPIDRRAEIARLPRILASKDATDDRLHDLESSIKKLAVTHHALAAAATSKDNEALQARIAELRASAENLSGFYQSLSTSCSKEKE